MASDIVTGSVTQVGRMAAAKPAAPERRSEAARSEKAQAARAEQAQKAEQALTEAMVGLSELIQAQHRSLEFSVDAASGRTVIRVLDAETKQTIRQIPPEEVLNLSRRLRGSAGGLINASA